MSAANMSIPDKSNRVVAFVANRLQFETLRENGQIYDDCVVATFDHDTVFELKSSGREVISLWCYLGEDEATGIEELAWTFCDYVAEKLKGTFVRGSCDFAVAMRDDWVLPWISAFNTRCVVEKVLVELTPAKVAFFLETDTGFIWDPPDPPPDVFNAQVARCVEVRGIESIPLRLKTVRPYEVSTAPQLGWSRPIPFPGERCEVLTFCDELGEKEQGLLLDWVQKHGLPWSIVALREPGWTLPYLYFRILSSLPFKAVEHTVREDSFSREFLPRICEGGRAFDAVLDNPHLDFLWRHYARNLLDGIRHYEIGRLLGEAFGPSLAIAGHTIFGARRCYAAGLRDAGIKTLALSHSGLTWKDGWKLYRYDRGPIAVWGRYERAMLAGWRPLSEPVFEVGSLRPDMAQYQNRAAHSRGARKPTVVLITSTIAYPYRVFASPSVHMETWTAILDVVRRHADWNFIIKVHPRYDHFRLYESGAFRALPNLSVVKRPLGEVLPDTDVAVAVHNMSTACIEAMSAGIPLVSIEAAVFKRSRGEFGAGAVTVDSVGELERVLEEFERNPASREEQVRKGTAWLRWVLPATGDEAVQKLLDVIRRLSSGHMEKAAFDPAARWVIDAIMTVDYAMRGAASLSECRTRFTALRNRGARLDFSRIEGLECSELGKFFLHTVVWERWPQDGGMSIPRAVWDVYRMLPRGIRPSLAVLRVYLVHAFLAQSKRKTRRLHQAICSLLAVILAPGRLLRRAEA